MDIPFWAIFLAAFLILSLIKLLHARGAKRWTPALPDRERDHEHCYHAVKPNGSYWDDVCCMCGGVRTGHQAHGPHLSKPYMKENGKNRTA